MTLAELLPPDGRAAVMGILNITPDSFSDGGQLFGAGGVDLDAVMRRAESMVTAGVDILDIGGESTRPGAAPVSAEEELSRVVPVLRELRKTCTTPISVDTSSPEVMQVVAAEGANLINDVRALSRPGALDAVARTDLPVCIMHMPAEPDIMQSNPHYEDVTSEVAHFLRSRADICIQAGISPENILLDPGFGFGKSLDHNMDLFRALPELVSIGYPLLVGVSRKRMIGALLDRDVEERMVGSVALAMLAVQSGAKVVRVHDVIETIDALKILNAVEGNRQ